MPNTFFQGSEKISRGGFLPPGYGPGLNAGNLSTWRKLICF